MSIQDIFREQTVQVDGSDLVLKEYSFADIFKFGDKPFLIVGASGGGKTTIAIDILFTLSKQATKMYYISATQPTIGENAIAAIPNCFKRQITFDNLNNAWQEIINGYEGMTKGETDLLKVINKLYPAEEKRLINRKYREYKAKMRTELIRELSNVDQISANQKADQLIEGWIAETLSRLIISGAHKYGTKDLSKDEINIVSSILSGEQKSILIIDDVTSQLTAMKASNQKVIFNGMQMSVANAFKALLEDILTRGRHYNCVVCMFVHAWDTINAKEKVQNFIVLERTAVDNLKRLKTVAEDVRKKMAVAADIVFKYKYRFIVAKNGGTQIMVGKANLHSGERLPLDPLNTKLVEAYDMIMKGDDVMPSANEDLDLDLDSMLN